MRTTPGRVPGNIPGNTLICPGSRYLGMFGLPALTVVTVGSATLLIIISLLAWALRWKEVTA
jgi:hypothetical protein